MNFIIRFLRSSIITAVFLFILLTSAGRLDYWQAWIYFSISLVSNIFMQLSLLNNPALAKERIKPSKDSQKWDKLILGIGFILTVLTLIIAALDTGRFHWSPEIPRFLSAIGSGIVLLGSVIFSKSMNENKFFSSVVRLQTEREHFVCTTGPYKFVRHPGYSGMVIGTIGIPILFLSLWAIIPSILSVMLIIVRTKLEDQFLKQNLKGYEDYQSRVAYKLLPGVW